MNWILSRGLRLISLLNTSPVPVILVLFIILKDLLERLQLKKSFLLNSVYHQRGCTKTLKMYILTEVMDVSVIFKDSCQCGLSDGT